MAALRFADVKQHATGHWLPLLAELAPNLGEAIEKTPRHVGCPVHGGSDGFRLYQDAAQVGGGVCNSCGSFRDGFALLGWLNGWDNSQTLREVAGVLGLAGQSGNTPPMPIKPITPKSTRDAIKSRNSAARDALRRVYSQLLPADHPDAKPLIAYLIERGLGGIVLAGLPDSLRYHPNLDYWEPDPTTGKPVKRGSHPAMVALIQSPNGKMATLHRTYLQADGQKAAVESPKKLMTAVERGASHGAAIQLCEPIHELCLAEGIETALAVWLATGKPTWATISAYGLESVQLPDCVQRVFIMADLDRSGRGEQAACKLAGRLENEGRTVSIHLPEHPIQEGEKSRDWLDVLNEKEETTP
ncbi:MAG: toprim domain-containing protein [Gammaproteobacteria bacterium]|nr:toprim domain-containing protein [Gammaproteobacteria bacterium]